MPEGSSSAAPVISPGPKAPKIRWRSGFRFTSMVNQDSAPSLVLTMVIDHGTITGVKEIPISKFKATCLAVLENVRKTRQPILVTRFGKPVAEVNPPSPNPRRKQRLGFMAGRAEIHGDIVHANPWLEAETPRRK